MDNKIYFEKYSYIIKHFYRSKKNVLRIIITSMFSVSLILITLLIIKTNESAMLNELFETFGKYTVSIDKESITYFDEISADSKVKDSIAFYQNQNF